MPPKNGNSTPTTDPFASGDTGPSTQPGDPDDPQANADTNTPTTSDDEPVRAAYEPAPPEDERWADFDETETRARFLERGDRQDVLDLIDYRTR